MDVTFPTPGALMQTRRTVLLAGALALTGCTRPAPSPPPPTPAPSPSPPPFDLARLDPAKLVQVEAEGWHSSTPSPCLAISPLWIMVMLTRYPLKLGFDHTHGAQIAKTVAGRLMTAAELSPLFR